MSLPLYQMAAVSAAGAGQLNQIAARLSVGQFMLAGAAWRFALAPLASPPVPPAAACVLRAEWGGAMLQLVASPALLGLLYAHQFPGAALATMPESIALAGLELAWREVTAAVARLSGRQLRLLSMGEAEVEADTATAAGAPAMWWFALSLHSEQAGDGLHAWLALETPALALLALLAEQQPLPAPRAPDPALPIRLRLHLASMRLPAAALRALAVHDVLMPDQVIDAAAPLLQWRHGRQYVLRLRLQGAELVAESTLEKVLMSVLPEMADVAADIDALEITLDFDLGEQQLTLGELSAVRPGQVFTLAQPAARRVTIRANGARYAYGDLVQVGERVGVRVLSLATPAPAAAAAAMLPEPPAQPELPIAPEPQMAPAAQLAPEPAP